MRRSSLAPLALLLLLTTAAARAQLPVFTSDDATLGIGGLLQVQGEGGDRGDERFTDDKDRIYLRRARINASGVLLKEFDYRVELDLAGSLSNVTGLRAQLTDGYVTWKRFPVAMFRAGQFKTPYGFEQLYSDARLFTIERTLASDRLTQSRQVGAMVLGELPGQVLTWSAGAFNGSGQNNNFNDNDAFLWVGRVAATPWLGKIAEKDASVSVGVDGFTSRDTSVTVPSESGLGSSFAGHRRSWGADTQLHAGPVDVWAEYFRTIFEPSSEKPAAKFRASGWYVLGAVYFLPRAQAVVRYDAFDPSDLVAGNTRRTWTVGANYLLKTFLKFQFDYMRVKVPGSGGQHKLLARLQAQI